ncbi:hypothetical protein AB6A40_000670 [Gnathostoma spinigerum]|uniref:isopentenyl-diphosphate Delta-isomerase n=1 Tax=Gnathostoma spinigerum TaxID=75299 RepID=A0ABD6E9A7_9BILA
MLFNQFGRFRSLHTRLSSSVAALPKVSGVQAKHLNEQCIAVDENDNALHPISKKNCHFIPTMALHRAFSVFLFTNDGLLVLQKRSPSKITFPSVWTNSCCSHPLWNERELQMSNNFIGVRRAAQRKLSHELGIDKISLDRMQVMGRFIYSSNSDKEWGENELDYAIVVTDFDVAVIKPNPEEVEEVMTVNAGKLQDLIKGELKFSPWFSLFVQQHFLYTWWKNLENLEKVSDTTTVHRLN